MIWQNPWAWVGLATLAIPVLIHLLGRRSANPQRFPSLRFLEASPLLATRRTRLTDLALLAARLGILTAAVAALAAPLILLDDPDRDPGRALSRAIIVDTSASMVRIAASAGALPADSARTSERAVDAARREAARLGDEARTSVTLETHAPAGAIEGAAAWLGTRGGRRELIVISDFQVGSIDSADLAGLPNDIGVQLVAVESVVSDEPIEIVARRGNQEIVARVVTGTDTGASITSAAGAASGEVASIAAGTVTVEWSGRPIATAGPPTALTILAGAAERVRADAALRAARAIVGEASIAAEQPIAIVHRGFESRAALLSDARPLASAWQGDLLARLRRDLVLTAAASAVDEADIGSDSIAPSASVPLAVVARSRTGEPVILAAGDRQGDRERMLLFVRTDAASLSSAALAAAVWRASAPMPNVAELEPARIGAATLARWERPASPTSGGRVNDSGPSDARWFWLIAMLLLALETWMRRERRAATTLEMAHDRAA